MHNLAISSAISLLKNGQCVALPTETVYGLAADAGNAAAVANIYRLKGRPSFNPLISHIADLPMGEKLAHFDDRAYALAEAFWPGALTLILPKKDDAPITPAVTAGLDTIALRMPAHPVMQQILREFGKPLAAPSANKSGGISPTTADHVRQSLGGNAPFIMDGGACEAGLESTIIALRDNGWQILRPGPITQEQVQAILGNPPLPLNDKKIEAPGQLAAHYAPGKKLTLNIPHPNDDDYYIGFGDMDCDDNLSVSGDLAEAASNLYAALHRGDKSDKPHIAICPLPANEMGAAIADRLQRAAYDSGT